MFWFMVYFVVVFEISFNLFLEFLLGSFVFDLIYVRSDVCSEKVKIYFMIEEGRFVIDEVFWVFWDFYRQQVECDFVFWQYLCGYIVYIYMDCVWIFDIYFVYEEYFDGRKWYMQEVMKLEFMILWNCFGFYELLNKLNVGEVYDLGGLFE